MNAGNTCGLKYFRQLTEVGVKESPFTGERLKSCFGVVKISVVCVDTDEGAGRAELFADGLGVAATAGGAIDNGLRCLDAEEKDGFLQENTLVAMIRIIHSRILQRTNRITPRAPNGRGANCKPAW